MKNSSPTHALWLATLLLATLNPQLSTCRAQGSLTPPGAPAPTFKTLDQIEPRTPISSVPFTITNSGHFYLTKSLTSTTDGVIINSDDVTLDLNGFTLSGDSGTGDYGVEVGTSTADGQKRVVIRNGIVRNFGSGVRIESVSSGVLVEGIQVHNCAGAGIHLGIIGTNAAYQCTIRNCVMTSNGQDGLFVQGTSSVLGGRNVIMDCQAIANAGSGFSVIGTNNLIIRNLAARNAINDYNILANNRAGIIVTPALTGTITVGGPGSGTTDPFANLKY